MDEVTREQWRIFWSFVGIVAIIALTVWGLIFGVPSCARAATVVTLAWDANTEPDLSGYRIYRAAQEAGPWEVAKEVALVTEAALDPLPDGRHCFAVTALDTVGNESEKSIPVCATLDATAPATPVHLVIKLTVRVEIVP